MQENSAIIPVKFLKVGCYFVYDDKKVMVIAHQDTAVLVDYYVDSVVTRSSLSGNTLVTVTWDK